MTRFAFIDREKAHYNVAVLCRLLKVSRSGFYAWASRPPSARAVADEVLTVQIRTAYDDNRKVYGAPRIHAELTEAGVRVGRKRVARLMRAAENVGCHRRKRSFSITRQDPRADAAPDRVDRKLVATAPNQLWVADVTYVPTVQGWLYLACVTDVFSRMVIGWSMTSPQSNKRRSSAVLPPAVAPSGTSLPSSARPSAPSPAGAHPSARHDLVGAGRTDLHLGDRPVGQVRVWHRRRWPALPKRSSRHPRRR